LKVVNITHGDDSDGLVCGALMRRLFDAEVMLANYDNLEEVLDGVDWQVGELYITDLNLRPALLDRILRIRARTPIHVIDHHPMAPKFREALTRAGVELTLTIGTAPPSSSTAASETGLNPRRRGSRRTPPSRTSSTTVQWPHGYSMAWTGSSWNTRPSY